MKKLGVVLALLLILPLSLYAKNKYETSQAARKSMQRPNTEFKVHTTGRLWSAVGNFGGYGDPNTVLPTYDWPGGTDVGYQWEGRFWIGAVIGGTRYCSHCDYGNYEFHPSEDGQWDEKKPGTSMHDIGCKFDEWDDGHNEVARQLGIKVIQNAMQWSVPGFEDFIAYEQRIIYNREESFHDSDTIETYISIVFDADCGQRVSASPHLDDLVSYDGWTNGEWTEAWHPPDRTKDGIVVRGGRTIPYPYDSVTISPPMEGYSYGVPTDTTGPDGVLDQMSVFGDETDEQTVYGDTLTFWRNFSYIYDGDNLTRPDEDETGTGDESELGRVPGYIGAIVLYAPPCPTDSVWVDDTYGDTRRLTRCFSHQWWNWSNDPGTDEDKMAYTLGTHPFSRGMRFMNHPFDYGAEVFDYRFMYSFGPFKIAAGDTMDFVWAGFIGFGLNGGYGYGKGADEGIFGNDTWYPGARWIVDQAIKAYYMGSVNSDPLHPSSPSEDVHWRIPIPPEVPYLEYSAGAGVVTLAWTDIAERTPDPIDGAYDFVGYRIYRAEYKPAAWKFQKGFVDSAFAADNPDKYPKDEYDWIDRGAGESFPHTYVDADIIYGIPYLYAVTSFDAGREGPPPMASLESGKVNYKKTALGAAVPVYVMTERSHGNEPLTSDDLAKITVAPNPYIGSARWELKYENRVQFMNLPGTCRIKIYSVTGDLVREIEHTDGSGDEYWNMLSRNDQEVVSGLYVYKVEAWNADGNPINKIGKLVIVRGRD